MYAEKGLPLASLGWHELTIKRVHLIRKKPADPWRVKFCCEVQDEECEQIGYTVPFKQGARDHLPRFYRALAGDLPKSLSIEDCKKLRGTNFKAIIEEGNEGYVNIKAESVTLVNPGQNKAKSL